MILKLIHMRVSLLTILAVLAVLAGVTATVAARPDQKPNAKASKEDQTSMESSSQSRFTDVFVLRDGRWQIVAGHSSRMPKPKQ